MFFTSSHRVCVIPSSWGEHGVSARFFMAVGLKKVGPCGVVWMDIPGCCLSRLAQSCEPGAAGSKQESTCFAHVSWVSSPVMLTFLHYASYPRAYILPSLCSILAI